MEEDIFTKIIKAGLAFIVSFYAIVILGLVLLIILLFAFMCCACSQFGRTHLIDMLFTYL